MLAMALGAVAQAEPSAEMEAVLKGVEGFAYDYDVMEDTFLLAPASQGQYVSGDASLVPAIKGLGEKGKEDFLFMMLQVGSPEYTYSRISRILFLVDGNRYEMEIASRVRQSGTTQILLGYKGLDLMRVIVDSTDTVKVRLYYGTDQVDFDLSDAMKAGIGTVLAAYETLGGPDQRWSELSMADDYFTVRLQ